MRRISEWECILLGGLTRFPELIFTFDDLEQHHFSSDFPFNCYKVLLETDVDDIKSVGMAGALINAKRKQLIDQDEFDIALDDFGKIIPDFQTENIQNAYDHIKNERLKNSIMTSLNKLDFNKMSTEEILKEVSEVAEGYSNQLSITDRTELLSDVSYKNIVNKSKVIFGSDRIDKVIKLQENSLCIIAARPFSGKTTYACKVVMENSIKNKVLFYTMEMTKQQIAYKARHYGMLYKYKNVVMVEKTEVTINQIAKTARKVKPDVIFIDQFNKIKENGKTEYEKFTTVARKLKILTGQLKIPIICMAQINRSSENKRPYMYNLKGSGSLEEEADVVIILHVADESRKDNVTNIYVDKNRTHNNHTGMVTMLFDPVTNFYREV